MSSGEIAFENVSKFYGEVLGVNRVDLAIPPGITSLVGPNGSGKTTLMNLMTGLLLPTRGRVRVLGISPDRPDELHHHVGYCTAYDSFPRGFTGSQFIHSYLRVHGRSHAKAQALAWRALERVNLTEAADRRIGAYSKGMRQRVKLAQAIAHDPTVLVLDEPLNGLDPMVRSEVIALLRDLAHEGRHIVLSSHILHEVDLMSDQVVLLAGGYVIAEGDIKEVRGELVSHPQQIVIRCDQPERLAAAALSQDHVVAVHIHNDRRGLVVQTHDVDEFYRRLTSIVLAEHIEIEAVAPADDDVAAVYEYLVEPRSEQSW